MTVWNGSHDGRSSPRPPTPLFDMPLLPLRLWIPGHQEDVAALYECNICPEKSQNIAQWVAHCRQYHSWLPSSEEPLGPQQWVVDDAYSEPVIKPYACPRPDRHSSFREQRTLNEHLRYDHSDDKPFKCPVSSCAKEFVQEKELKKVHSDERHVTCLDAANGCLERFKDNKGRNHHVRKRHLDLASKLDTTCTTDDCN